MFPLIAQDAFDPDSITGFLGTRGSLMLDFVFLAMFAVVPLMGISIYLVKFRRKYELHKWFQTTLGSVLLIAVIAFEVDMRFFTDWQTLAGPSPYFDASDSWNWVWTSIVVHLFFAIPTTVLWIFVIVQGFRKFPRPAEPNEYSQTHLFWARLAAFGMLMTAVTGWIFYWMAFTA